MALIFKNLFGILQHEILCIICNIYLFTVKKQIQRKATTVIGESEHKVKQTRKYFIHHAKPRKTKFTLLNALTRIQLLNLSQKQNRSTTSLAEPS